MIMKIINNFNNSDSNTNRSSDNNNITTITAITDSTIDGISPGVYAAGKHNTPKVLTMYMELQGETAAPAAQQPLTWCLRRGQVQEGEDPLLLLLLRLGQVGLQ